MKTGSLVNIKAVVAGFVSDFVASYVFTILLSLLAAFIIAGKGYEGEDFERMLLSVMKGVPYRTFSLVAGLGFTMMGGYIAARLANGGELFHSGAVGILNIIFGLFFINMNIAWYNFIAFILVLPAAVMGGNIAKQRRLGQDNLPSVPEE